IRARLVHRLAHGRQLCLRTRHRRAEWSVLQLIEDIPLLYIRPFIEQPPLHHAAHLGPDLGHQHRRHAPGQNIRQHHPTRLNGDHRHLRRGRGIRLHLLLLAPHGRQANHGQNHRCHEPSTNTPHACLCEQSHRFAFSSAANCDNISKSSRRCRTSKMGRWTNVLKCNPKAAKYSTADSSSRCRGMIRLANRRCISSRKGSISSGWLATAAIIAAAGREPSSSKRESTRISTIRSDGSSSPNEARISSRSCSVLSINRPIIACSRAALEGNEYIRPPLLIPARSATRSSVKCPAPDSETIASAA